MSFKTLKTLHTVIAWKGLTCATLITCRLASLESPMKLAMAVLKAFKVMDKT